jgi:hypothetical protein
MSTNQDLTRSKNMRVKNPHQFIGEFTTFKMEPPGRDHQHVYQICEP